MIDQNGRSFIPAIVVPAFLALVVARGLAVEVCFTPNELHGWNMSVDCDSLNPTVHDNSWYGYSEVGVPCRSTTDCISATFTWSISSSDTEPDVWVGPLSRPTAELHLWFLCMSGWQWVGWQWAEFAVEATGGAEIVAFEERNGVQNLGTATDLHLVPPGGCGTQEAILVGTWTVSTAVSVEPGAWGSIKSLYR